MKKSATEIDRHVGSRVRMRRMMVGMSQEKLGDALGVTFQQVQKYEKGTNRIGASRLQRIAEILNVPPAFFFEEMPNPASPTASGFAEDKSSFLIDFLSSSEGLQLTRAFVRIKDPKARRRLIDLVSALAEPEESATSEADDEPLPQQ